MSEIISLYQLLYLLGAGRGERGLVEYYVSLCLYSSGCPGASGYVEHLRWKLYLVAGGYLSLSLGLLLLTYILYRSGVLRLLYNRLWYLFNRESIVVGVGGKPRGRGVGGVVAVAIMVSLGAVAAYIGGVIVNYYSGVSAIGIRGSGDRVTVYVYSHWSKPMLYRVRIYVNGTPVYRETFLLDPDKEYAINIWISQHYTGNRCRPALVMARLYVFDTGLREFRYTGDEVYLVVSRNTCST